MSKTSYVVHGMLNDYIDYAAYINYLFNESVTLTKSIGVQNTKKEIKNQNYNNVSVSKKRNYPKKMLKR